MITMKKNTIYTICIAIVAFLIVVLTIKIATDKKEPERQIVTYNLVLKGSKTIEIESGSKFNDPGYIVYNSDHFEVDANVDVNNNINTNVPGTYKITYSIDGKVVAEREVVVKEKEQKKNDKYNFVLLGGDSINVLHGTEFDDPGYIATDKSGEDLSNNVTVIGGINPVKEGKYEIHYVLKKDNERVELVRTVYVVSANAEFKLKGKEKIEVEYGSTYKDEGVIAKYNGSDYSETVTTKGKVDTKKAGEYKLTYTFKTQDFVGSLTRIVIVKDKPIEPVEQIDFKLKGNEQVEIYQGEFFDDPGVIAVNDKNEDLSNSVKTESNLNISTPGTYKIKYSLKISNYEKTIERTITVLKKVNITFKLVGNNPITIEEGTLFLDPGYSAIGDDGVNYNKDVKVTSNVNANAVGTYTIKYTIDVKGNNTTYTRTVVVTKRKPVAGFRLLGSQYMTIDQDSKFTDPGYMADDTDGNDLRKYVTVSGKVDTSKPGTYVITYKFKYENYDKTLTRTVVVKRKLILVEFKLQGNKTMSVKMNSTFKDPGFTAQDTEGHNLKSYVTTTGTVNTKKVGTYTITYKLKYENITKTLTRTVHVTGSNYTVSQKENKNGVVITIQSNINDFGYFLGPDSKKSTSEKYNYTVTKNGTYTFYLYNKDNHKVDTITVKVDTFDTDKPSATCSASVSNKTTTYKVTATDKSGIAKYVHNNKTYTTSTFSVANDVEDDTVRVYDNKGNYLDVTCVYDPISRGNKSIIDEYNSATLKYWIEKPGTYFTVTHIWVKDAYNQMNVEVNTKFGTLETTKTIVDNVINKYNYYTKGMVAVNASGFLMNAGSSYENYVKEWRLSPTAPVIFTRGKLVRDFTKYTLPGTTPVYALKKNGYLTYYSFGSGSGAVSNNQKIVQQMKNDGIRNTMSFSPVLVKNYTVASNDTSPNIRQALCQIDRNNFVIITNTNGTGNRGVGFNFKNLAEYFVNLNCRTAYNLDGGGSTNYYYKKNSAQIKSVVTTSRRIADILYFVEL